MKNYKAGQKSSTKCTYGGGSYKTPNNKYTGMKSCGGSNAHQAKNYRGGKSK